MAGQPKWHAFVARMAERNADEEFFEHIASGGTVAQYAATMKVSRSLVMRWVYLTEERQAKYEKAKIERASAHADEVLDIADAVGDPQDKKVRIDARRWLAGVDDRKAFGERSGPTTVINIGQLHLDALRARGGPDALPAQHRELLPAITDADIEEVEDEGQGGSEAGRREDGARRERGEEAAGGRADDGGPQGDGSVPDHRSGREPEGQGGAREPVREVGASVNAGQGQQPQGGEPEHQNGDSSRQAAEAG